MTLIKSISGIRGTIGGKTNDNLTPLDIVKFAAAYTTFIKHKNMKMQFVKIVVGRDARISGNMVEQLISNTLVAMSVEVIQIGLATTPTTEMAVVAEQAQGGIIITASHNPMQWNALKLLNEKGEFLSASEGKEILNIVEKEDFKFAEVDKLGCITRKYYLKHHIKKIIELELVDVDAIRNADFKIAVDGVNSVGGIAIPMLLNDLGVRTVHELYCKPTGYFPHNPEPLPEHLTEISKLVNEKKLDMGLVVDPDVDRLAIIDENGDMFGEEYTLVAIADYVLQYKGGNTVSNMSSSRALRDITHSAGFEYYTSAVGEVNVVEQMKNVNAIIGGEGNGGVIYPELHYGRDALVGVALLLTYLAKRKILCSKLRKEFPEYYMSKLKVELTPQVDVDAILGYIKKKYESVNGAYVTDIDGVKIDFEESWVHLRKSNTEPIIRIYTEAKTSAEAQELAEEIKKIIDEV